jgi:ABC-type transport system involved in Fe-S cluster assembly fused permease/ATPase subunit
MTRILVKTQVDLARDLQEFSLGTYAEHAIQAAIDSKNEELISITIAHYRNERAQIEEAEDNQNDCF